MRIARKSDVSKRANRNYVYSLYGHPTAQIASAFSMIEVAKRFFEVLAAKTIYPTCYLFGRLRHEGYYPPGPFQRTSVIGRPLLKPPRPASDPSSVTLIVLDSWRPQQGAISEQPQISCHYSDLQSKKLIGTVRLRGFSCF